MVAPAAMTQPSNVWGELGDIGDGVRGERLLERASSDRLRSAVWELDPSKASGGYHVHHATEELLVVLRGRPTLRTPEGERQLEEGDVVHFPAGPEGAHQVINKSDDVVRFLMAAAHSDHDIIEYPDNSEIAVWTAAESPQQGKPLFFVHKLESE
jgi:uncharacterized cupin superfamily protein